MDFNQIKKYWEDRATADRSAQSTTQDYYLRDIEFRVVRNLIAKYRPDTVLDVGCGDARTTARLAAEFPTARFIGVDYSESMIKNAQAIIDRAHIGNLEIMLGDIIRPLQVTGLAMVYSTRCIINLPTWELQRIALKNIADTLQMGGFYVMIENFIEGHDNFNRVRREFGLPEIPAREHNLFLTRPFLVDYISNMFDLIEEVNISSTYYLVSRVIYSKICQKAGPPPDYFDPHHKYAARLPFAGEFGPVRMLCMRKK